jgi:type II secretory pathway component PulF
VSFSLWSFFKGSGPESVHCGSSEIALFTRQLAVLVGSGIPIHLGLEVMARGEDVLALRVVPVLAQRVATGSRLSASMARFPRVFPSAYVSLVKGAEESGQLHLVLNQLSDWLERKDRLARQVKRALTYPVMVLLTTVLLALGLFRTVIPGILEAVLGTGVALPGPTRLLLALVGAVESPATWVLLVTLGLMTAGYLRSPEGYRKVSMMAVLAPGLGELLLFTAAARLSMTLSMLLGCGCDLLASCQAAAESSGLPLLVEDVDRVLAQLREGRALSDVYGASSLYPALLRDMLKAGEEAGKVTAMVKHAGRLFEQEASGRTESLANLLEPVVLAGISLGVGFVIMAVMLPMSSMLNAL